MSTKTRLAIKRRMNASRVLFCCLILAMFVGWYLSSSQVRIVEALSVTTLGVPITQNFDTLPASGSATFVNDTTLPGWYSARTGTGTTIVANDGSSNSGNLYSYGTGTNTDRAFGSVGSGNAAIGNLFWGIVLTNNTGSTITSLDVAYTGEQWRNSAAAAQTVAFSYTTGASFTGTLAEFQAAGTAVTQLDFTSPVTGGVAVALDGNLAANRTAISFTIGSLSLANGQSIFLRWSDPDHGGADHGLSIDDFSVTPQGGGGTTLSIGDVTQVEANAGTTNFNFTVTLSAPAGAGGVTFDASTADGTTNPANAPGDYTALVNQPGSITAGNTTTTVTVVVNGDATAEPDETFFVNITNIVGATAGDAQGLGTITNDDFSLTPIHTIQGNGSTSPLAGNLVTTSGVVTLLKSNGFFLQEPDASVDADPNTSEGIFVFTSSAPTVLLGNSVSATGTVTEFGTGGTITELGSVTSVVTNSTGNPLPAAIPLTPTILDPTALPSQPQLEKFESMRMTGALNTVSPNDNFFDVDTVLSSVARPIREIGLEISATIPPDPTSGLPDVNIPRWDENPERLSVDTNGRAGSTGMTLTSNVSLGTVTGVLDFAFAEYHLIPDFDPNPSPNMTFVPVPVPLATEFTVGCFNIENFANGATQRQKAARAIRQVMRYPDIIGHEEIASLAALQALRDQVNNDAVGAGDPNPLYEAYLTGTGAQNVGFLVKTARVSVISVTEEPVGTYINPLTGLPEALHDRPPLVLRATVDPTGPNPIPVIVVVNHPRSFIGIEDDPSPPGDGQRVRAKRKAQGESIAALLDTLQDNNPGNSIMTVGDFNAFQFNDGYTDPIATIKGTPTVDDQTVVDASPDVVSPDFVNLTDTLPVSERYSFVFEGTPQALDHVIVNRNAITRFTRYAIARFDADFPDTPAAAFANDPSRPERASDHDAPVAYFNLTTAPTAADGTVTGRITDANGAPIAGAVVNLSGTQNRKFITDANGEYRFDNVETGGFYTVRPSRVNYSFSPVERSFSQLGNSTEAAFTGSLIGGVFNNPLDTPEYFVRQHYLDFLNRDPDESGFNFWSDQVLTCGGDSGCIERRTINVSAAYFLSIEFQQTGGLVDSLYRASYGRRPLFAEFMPDAQTIGQGVIVGNANWAQRLAANKQAFIAAWVGRPDFSAAYDGLSNSQYVDALISHTGVDFSPSEREALVSSLANGATRAEVLGSIVEDGRFVSAKRNEMFVMMQYFGYLRRDPDTSGYAFWLHKLNEFGGNFEQAEMVKAFIVSGEYRNRFR